MTYAQKKDIYKFESIDKTLHIIFYKDDILRIKIGNKIPSIDEYSYMLNEYSFPPVTVSEIKKNDFTSLTSKRLTLKINHKDLSIEIYNINGELLSSEKNNGSSFIEDKIIVNKWINPDEHFFGFGERMDFLNQKGKKVSMNVGRGIERPHIVGAYNILEANYAPVPFMMSTMGYGIFYHTSQPSEFDLGKENNNQLSFSAKGQFADYFFMYGPEFTELLNHYTDLTGKSPLLPRFAHGLHVGTYSGGTWGFEHLTSGEYVINLAKRYREKGIPFDILHLDSTWRLFGKNGGSGATSFEWRETFTNPKGMFDSLYTMNINMVGLHVRPRLDNGLNLNLLDQARAYGHIYPEENNQGEFINFFDQNAVNWWWDNAVMKIASIGAMFLKTDEGSAFGRVANESDKTGPTSEEALKLHNVFPVVYAKAPFEKFKSYNKIRGLNHTREGYAGIQRYPFIWAGDWPSEWQYFAPVIRAGINIGLSGVGYWSHNMGGFEHDADPELYARWVQFGMFSPIAHVFGMDHPGYKEPWNYGQKAEEIFTEYAKLRYRILPYIYSAAYQQNQTGLPIMRALVIHNQDDFNTYTIDDQYYFGGQLIVAPVVTKGAQTRVIYLPKGKWFDFWTGKEYQGGSYFNILTPLEQLPIFAKEGAIIPYQKDVLFDNKEDYQNLTIEVFPGNGRFELYEDDGLTESYQNGEYSLTEINTIDQEHNKQIKIFKIEGIYEPTYKSIELKIHSDKEPVQIKMNNKVIHFGFKNNEWSFDSAKKIILLHNFLYENQDITIVIDF